MTPNRRVTWQATSDERKFLATLLGGAAAVAWPLAAHAQETQRMRRIGVLMNTSADDPEGQARIAAFHQGLQEWGWTLGRNARIDVRWGALDADNSRRYAAELVALAPNVILASACFWPNPHLWQSSYGFLFSL